MPLSFPHLWLKLLFETSKMRKAKIGALVTIPRLLLEAEDELRIEEELTVVPKYDDDGEGPIRCYEFLPRAVKLPLVYGLELLRRKRIRYEDERTFVEMASEAKIPEARDDLVSGQSVFFHELIERFEQEENTLAVAHTGSGKTVAGLRVAAEFNARTLIICPNVEVALYWKREAEKHLGVEAGVLRGGTEEDPEEDVVCAVVHSFINRCEARPQFGKGFGLTVWDEIHRMGARWFRRSMDHAHSLLRLGITATPERKDECSPVFMNHIGRPSIVKDNASSEPCEVRVVEVKPTPYTMAVREIREVLLHKAIPEHDVRNVTICELIEGGYGKGRDGLGLGDSVAHLATIYRLLVERGIPEEDIGLYTRSIPKSLCGRETRAKGKYVQQRDADLKKIREKCSIILATYGMCKESFNVPRLSYIVEISPRADGLQHIGRIRRPMEGKPTPICFTLKDRGVPLLTGYFRSRLADWETDQNITIKK